MAKLTIEEATRDIEFLESPFRRGKDVDLLAMAKSIDTDTLRWYIDASRVIRSARPHQNKNK